jgi:hypothetical protein
MIEIIREPTMVMIMLMLLGWEDRVEHAKLQISSVVVYHVAVAFTVRVSILIPLPK